MPSPWLAVLKNVPWIEVVRNATVVAEGARKLWNAVSRQPTTRPPSGTVPDPALLADSQGMAGVQARLAAIDRTLDELHSEMLASSELIRNLAEQNTQLVARIEANRVRTVWLAAATAVLGVSAAVTLMLALAR